MQCTKTHADKYKGTAVGDGKRELNFELQTQNSAHTASSGCGADVWLTPVTALLAPRPLYWNSSQRNPLLMCVLALGSDTCP